MVAVPAVRKVTMPSGVTRHTPGVEVVKVTARPEEADAVRVGVVPKVCVPGSPNVMVWDALGVTAAEAAEEAPVPAELAAATVKV